MDTSPTMEALADFDDALARAFAKVARARPDGVDKQLKKDGKDRRYVTLASVDDACREALTSEGFSFPQLATTATTEGGGLWLTITTQLRRKGVKIETTLGLPVLGQTMAGGQGFRPPTAQSVGSAMTYGRRYALSALLGVCPDEDDDGTAASRHPDEPVDRLWHAFETKRNALCQAMKTDAKAVTRLVREAAGITHDREPTDPEVRSMIAAAEHMLTPPREPDLTPAAIKSTATEPAKPRASAKASTKAKAPKCEAADLPSWISDQAQADAFRAWRKAGQAVIDHRSADFRDAHGEAPSADTIAAFRADVLRVSSRAVGAERFDPKTAGAEGLTLAADALVQDLEARAQQGRAA